MLADANEHVITHLTKTQALRDNVEPRQVMRLVSGVATVVDQAGLDSDQATPMLDIVIDGILRGSSTS
jgi:hypothetical protein